MIAAWDVIRRCPHCDDQGLLPDRSPCDHQPVYVAAAERGAAKAKAAIRTSRCCTTHTATCGVEDWCCEHCPQLPSIGRPQHPTEPTGDRS